MPGTLRISEAASFAMHASAMLAANKDQKVSAHAMASVFGVSEAHLSKVLQRLVKVGLLASVRGPRGGFSLARDEHDITLLEVYEAIEGPLQPAACLFALPACNSGDTCILGTALSQANQMLYDHLKATSLAELKTPFQLDEDGTLKVRAQTDQEKSKSCLS